eukprot:792769-Pyramimonas_sp.AAC.1
MRPMMRSPEAFFGSKFPMTRRACAGHMRMLSTKVRRSESPWSPTSGSRSRSPGDIRPTPRPVLLFIPRRAIRRP